MSYSRILATGSYLPEKVLTNFDLEKMVATSDEWIKTRTGISTRHIAAEHETTATMGSMAARRALQMANMAASEIDLIVMATATPDHVFPSAACTVQNELGCKNAAAFDVSAACSGFVYALSIADQYIRAGKMNKVLVVGSETISKVVDWQDRSTCILFGDGAGAVLLEAATKPGIIDTNLHTMGEYGDILVLPNANLNIDPLPQKITMQGREVFKLAVNHFSHLVIETLAKNNIGLEQLNWLIPHQANIRIIELLAKKLMLPMQQIVLTLSEQGNTSAATVPLALDAAVRDGRIQRQQLLMLTAFGGGITWGSVLVRY